MSDGGIYQCLDRALDIQRSVPDGEWRDAVKQIPDVCARPDRCSRGSCRQVSVEYLRAMWRRARAAEAARVRAHGCAQ